MTTTVGGNADGVIVTTLVITPRTAVLVVADNNGATVGKVLILELAGPCGIPSHRNATDRYSTRPRHNPSKLVPVPWMVPPAGWIWNTVLQFLSVYIAKDPWVPFAHVGRASTM